MRRGFSKVGVTFPTTFLQPKGLSAALSHRSTPRSEKNRSNAEPLYGNGKEAKLGHSPKQREEEMSGCKNKRQRVDEEGEQADGKAGLGVRLSEELRGLLGGRLYAKE